MSHILSRFSKTACRTFICATYIERLRRDRNEVRESIQTRIHGEHEAPSKRRDARQSAATQALYFEHN
ncbi:hypothetical protein [Pandoraea sp. NE5]|uniref:hypothetical protein n=1 Tax=Pandoraea sp. NE5 TaxID=2904129 RepID=UPI0021C40125|nr:hypothetical protein [Pandoraea sp. NE5]